MPRRSPTSRGKQAENLFVSKFNSLDIFIIGTVILLEISEQIFCLQSSMYSIIIDIPKSKMSFKFSSIKRNTDEIQNFSKISHGFGRQADKQTEGPTS